MESTVKAEWKQPILHWTVPKQMNSLLLCLNLQKGGHAVSARWRPLSADLTSKPLPQGGLIPSSWLIPEPWQIAAPGFGHLRQDSWSGWALVLLQDRRSGFLLPSAPGPAQEPTSPGAAALWRCRSSSTMPLPRLHQTSEEKTCIRCRAVNGIIHVSGAETKYR